MTKTSSPPDGPFQHEVRELRAPDLDNGFLEALGSLSDLEGLTPEEARKTLKAMKRTRLYHVFVAVAPEGKVIGTTTLLVEQKFSHKGGLVGHIEDVAVRKGYEGKGVGRSLVKTAIENARQLGCYKCILDCKAELVGFYEALGLRTHDVGMRVDLKRRTPRRR